MKIFPSKLLASVQSAAKNVVAKGAELKDAVVPVLAGPVKPLPSYFYCADGATVLGPLSPDALYELVWLHETIPQDVPVVLTGTEQWIPFLALEETLFSKRVVKEGKKIQAAKTAERIELAARAERLRLAEEAEKCRLAAFAERVRAADEAEQRRLGVVRERRNAFQRALRKSVIMGGATLAGLVGLFALSEWATKREGVVVNYPVAADISTPAATDAAPPPSPIATPYREVYFTPSATPQTQTIYVKPLPTPEIRVVYVTPTPDSTPRVIYVAPPAAPSPRVVYVTPPPAPTPRIVYVTPTPTPTPVYTPALTDTPASSRDGTVWVNSYTRKNGTYVQGHSRSKHK